MLSVTNKPFMLIVIVLIVVYAECHYTERRGALDLGQFTVTRTTLEGLLTWYHWSPFWQTRGLPESPTQEVFPDPPAHCIVSWISKSVGGKEGWSRELLFRGSPCTKGLQALTELAVNELALISRTILCIPNCIVKESI